MKKLCTILVILFSLYGYSQHPNSTKNSISKEWALLSDSIKGCTTGGQYCINGRCGGEACCFDTKSNWRTFFKHNKKDLSSFLINQLSDTTKSKTHICPFLLATKGELAIYCLQKIHKINWYDLDPKYYKYKDGTLEGGKDYYSEQAELQKKLRSKDGLDLLTKKWIEKLK